ncbi:hypothetical protein, partial [Yoonia sp.]|uniref:hypothetical protein n=1 Tax=Yoonia sp. TaxID=2212373 RepID=UPI003974FC08
DNQHRDEQEERQDNQTAVFIFFELPDKSELFNVSAARVLKFLEFALTSFGMQHFFNPQEVAQKTERRTVLISHILSPKPPACGKKMAAHRSGHS